MDEQGLKYKLISEADTSGFKKTTEEAKKTKAALEAVNGTPVNIKSDNIFSAAMALNSFNSALHQTNSLSQKVSLKQPKLSFSKPSYNTPKPSYAPVKQAIKDNNTLQNFLNRSVAKSVMSSYMPSLQAARVDDYYNKIASSTAARAYQPTTERVGELYRNYEQQRPMRTMMSNTLGGVLGGSMLPQLDTSGITAYKEQVDSLKQTVGEMANQTLSDLYNGVRRVDDELGTFGNESKTAGDLFKDLLTKFSEAPNVIDKVSKAFNRLDFTKLVNLWRTVRRITSGLVGAVENAAGYEESLNLYTMALGKYASQASAWSDIITTKLKLDPSQLMQYTGAFYNLVKGMNVASDDAYIMSKNLTQLTYDMASYLNISNEAAQAKIQSAMAGQSRAVATVGVATQVASLQELAYSMNIKKKVANMTQAEKTYLRYIQLMKSTEQMQGDLGRTMITPANAIRTLKNQVNLLGRAIGQVLTPVIMKAIPYVIALTNVLTRLAATLAGKLGYAITDIDYDSTLSFESAEEGVNNLNDLAGAATKAGKSIQNTLAPFDELNVVMSESSGVGGGYGAGAINDLIDGSVWEKALPQYDMLKNYTDDLVKQAESLEGKVTGIVAVIGGFVAGGVFIKLVNFIKDLGGALKTAGEFFGSIGSKLGDKFLPILEGLGKIPQFVGGGIAALASMQLSQSAVENATTDSDLVSGLKIGGSIASGAAAGAAFGGPIGAIIGAFVSVIHIAQDAQAEIERTTKLYEVGYGQFQHDFGATGKLIDQFNESYKNTRETILATSEAKLKDINSYEVLYKRLMEITDAQGNVTEGHRNEAKFLVDKLNVALGTNIELRNGQIKNMDKTSAAIKKLIEQKRAEIKLEAMTAAYEKALLKEAEAVDTLRDAEEGRRKALKMVNEDLEKHGYISDTVRQEYEKWDEKYKESAKTYQDVIVDKERWETAYTNFLKGNYQLVEEAYDKSMHNQELTFANTISSMTNKIKPGGELGEELTNGWKILAITNVEQFNKELQHISNEETRQKILDAVGQLSEGFSFEGKTAADFFTTGFRYNTEQDFKYHPITPTVAISPNGVKQFTNDVKTSVEKTTITPKITVGNAPSEMRSDIVSYFNKKPLSLNWKSESNSSGTGMLCTFKANGGYVDSGDLFFANENGVPEYITSVGNKSAVINQNQMVQTLTNAITAGFQQFGGNRASNVTVYVGDKKLYEGQGEYQNRQNDRYGTTVVRI